MMFRISASLALLFSMLFLPFWVSVVIVLASMLYFHFFWEAVFILLLSDLLYGTSEPRFFGIVFVSSMGALLLLISIEALKKKIRFYK